MPERTKAMPDSAGRREVGEDRDRFFNVSADMLVVCNFEGIFTRVNPAWGRAVGYTDEELTSRPFIEFVHPEDRACTVVELDKLIAGGEVVNFENRYICRDESHKWLLWNATSMPDQRLIYAVAHDITARRQSEEKLRESEDRYRDLVENTHELLCVHDLDGRLIEANQAAANILGYDLDDLKGRDVREFIAPDMRGAFTAYLDKVRREGTAQGMMQVLTRTGEKRIWVYKNILRTEGLATPVVRGMAHDITERIRAESSLRESEERYRIVAETATDAIITINEQSIIQFVNNATSAIFGYEKDELLGRNLSMLMPDHMRHFHRMGLERYVKTGYRHISWQAVELPGLHKSGREISLELSFSDFKRGGHHYFTGMIRDISERKASEGRLREMNLQLIQAQKIESIGTLTSGVAHNFRNILAAIDLGTGLLRKNLARRHDVAEGDDILKYIQIINEASQRAAKATAQLLAFSRKEMLKPVILDLNDLILNDIDSLLQQSLDRRILLRHQLQPMLGRVRVDKMQMEQVIINLALNARDAMPAGGELLIQTCDVYVDEETAQRQGIEEAGHYVRLTLADTGAGMDAETSERVFEPFFTTKEPGKGTGLGLSMAYGIIKQSGGHVRVESEAGRGTSFEIFLPRAGEVAATHDVEGDASAEVFTGHETILLVEDDALVRPLLHEELELSGFDVLVAENGNAAERIAREYPGPIHITITGLNMPGIGGEELAARLGTMRPAMKILFISGYPQDALGQHVAQVDFLQKPFAIPLSQKVREVLNRAPETDS